VSTGPVRSGGAPRRRAGLGDPGADFDAEAFAQLYSKLAATVSAAQTVGARNDQLLSVMLPGQYLEQNLDPTDPYTQYLLSNVLNPTLECAWVVRRGAATIADVYETVLNGKEAPLVELSPRQRRDLDEATALLYEPDGTPTAFYQDYLADQDLYVSALDRYEEATATARNGGPPVPPAVRAALDAAGRRWREHGHRADVDRAALTIDELAAFEPEVYWHELATRFRASTRRYDEDSDYQHTTTAPPYPRWFDDEGWIAFTFDLNDFNHQDRSGGIGVGDGCDDRCPGPLRPGAYGGFHSSASGFTVDSLRLPTGVPARFVLTAELRRIEIRRSWLNPLVLHSRAWRWSPASASYGVVVSSGGNLAGSVVPTGVMPVLPTSALLARNVIIDWSDDGELARAYGQRRTLGHDLRWGPLRLGRASNVGGHIEARDPQLIGYVSQLLPRCPDPDPRLPWPRRTPTLLR
jgi:hypothetical protein